MRLHDLFENLVQQYDVYQAQVRIQQPGYLGRITVTVSAPSAAAARALIKAQYNVKTHEIGQVKKMPAGKGLV
jgi:hypothetical protein